MGKNKKLNLFFLLFESTNFSTLSPFLPSWDLTFVDPYSPLATWWSLFVAHCSLVVAPYLLFPFCFSLIAWHMLFITLRYIFCLFFLWVFQCILGYNFIKGFVFKFWNFPSKICATPKVGNAIMCRLRILFFLL